MSNNALLFEPHVHTNFSDGMHYKIMLKAAMKLGIEVIAITDHNTMEGINPAKKYIREVERKKNKNIVLIPAEEILVDTGFEILAYFINEPIKPRLSTSETIDQIHDQGGLAAIAHPLRMPLNYKSAFNILSSNNFDGIEIWNMGFPPFINKRTCSLAKQFPNLFKFGGTDAHFYWQFKLVKNYLQSELDLGSIYKAFKDNKNKVENVWLGIPYFAYYFHKFFLKNRKIVIKTLINNKK
ncbi:MAG: PHP domain-containing protein [Candidatus Helarchaeota archaeon]